MEAALEQSPGSLLGLGEEKEANMEIDYILEDLEKRQGSLEEVRPEPNYLIYNQDSERRGDQKTDPWCGNPNSQASNTTPCLIEKGG